MCNPGRVEGLAAAPFISPYPNRHIDPAIDASQPLVHHMIFKPSARKAVFRDPALRDAFNAGLKIIRKNGVYAGIYKKYNERVEP